MEKPIDFSPLSKIDKGQIMGHTVNMQYVALAELVAGLLSFFLLAGPLTSKEKDVPLIIFYLALASVLIARALITFKRLKKQDNDLWFEFAAVNGWQASDSVSTLNLVPPSIANIGHSVTSSPGVAGILQDLPFNFFNYSFTTGSGKYQVQHDKLIVSMNLGHQLPTILLVHKTSFKESLKDSVSLTGEMTDPYNKPPNSEKISLEGSFNDYFDVISQNGDDIPVREIITPDIMQLLTRLQMPCNLEFFGNQLYFIAHGFDNSTKQITELFEIAESITAALRNNYNLAHPQTAASTPKPARS